MTGGEESQAWGRESERRERMLARSADKVAAAKENTRAAPVESRVTGFEGLNNLPKECGTRGAEREA